MNENFNFIELNLNDEFQVKTMKRDSAIETIDFFSSQHVAMVLAILVAISTSIKLLNGADFLV